MHGYVWQLRGRQRWKGLLHRQTEKLVVTYAKNVVGGWICMAKNDAPLLVGCVKEDAHRRRLDNAAERLFGTLAVGNVEHGSDEPAGGAVRVGNDGFVEDDFMEAAVGVLDA